jgi:hypothetical protein
LRKLRADAKKEVIELVEKLHHQGVDYSQIAGELEKIALMIK